MLEYLGELFVGYGPPDHIRSDNGSEFTATAVRERLGRVGVKTLFIEPGSPWENGYNESFKSKLRDELLNREIFNTLREAQVPIERWCEHYKTKRPHSPGLSSAGSQGDLAKPCRSAQRSAPGGPTGQPNVK